MVCGWQPRVSSLAVFSDGTEAYINGQDGSDFIAASYDPFANDGDKGIIVAFTNCLNGCSARTEFGEFPVEGTETMLRIVVEPEGRRGVPPEGLGAALRAQDGLLVHPDSIPVESVFAVSGESFPACNLEHAKLTITFTVGEPTFIRCDANDDGVANLADAIRMINEAFRNMGPESQCEGAFDCNGSSGTGDTLADVSYLLMYLFQGGSAPPAPFPACGFTTGTNCNDQRSCFDAFP